MNSTVRAREVVSTAAFTIRVLAVTISGHAAWIAAGSVDAARRRAAAR
ncbi:MAG: hypothetical protein L0H93_16610 [Nocardioides sp.]|nr:hypothetical protein [Nocardioides sp.]